MAKAKQKPEDEKPAIPPELVGKKYKLNPEKPYNPKAAHNVRSWITMQELLPATLGDLVKAMVYEYKDDKDKPVPVKHTNFVGYMMRGKHIVPA